MLVERIFERVWGIESGIILSLRSGWPHLIVLNL
jgi:hypothetical protein